MWARFMSVKRRMSVRVKSSKILKKESKAMTRACQSQLKANAQTCLNKLNSRQSSVKKNMCILHSEFFAVMGTGGSTKSGLVLTRILVNGELCPSTSRGSSRP